MAESYYARVRARRGLLLGGVRMVTSSRFSTEQQAQTWATALTSNQEKRDCLVTIHPSDHPPDIDEDGALTRPRG